MNLLDQFKLESFGVYFLQKILINEISCRVDANLEIGRGFRLSRCKMEYVECKFSKRINKDWGVAKFDGQGILE